MPEASQGVAFTVPKELSISHMNLSHTVCHLTYKCGSGTFPKGSPLESKCPEATFN
jgi:hypothetical protein